jgi:predicted metal-dependent enzyme (double-stranded beta helix superfamily)
MAYGIEALVEDLKRLDAANAAPKDLLNQIAPLAERVAQDQSWVQPSFYEVDETQGIGITVLHEEPDHSLLVEVIVWAPGKGVSPHDHQTWGVVVGLDGTERNTFWQRKDDGSRKGHAILKAHHEADVGKGQTIVFMPDDIHSVQNLTERPSLSLHIYGKNLAFTGRSEFDTESNTMRPCPVRAKRPAL